jgi:hypothetical protein
MTTHDLLLSRVAAARWPPIALPEGMQPSVPLTASLRLHCGRRDAMRGLQCHRGGTRNSPATADTRFSSLFRCGKGHAA